MTLPLSDKTTQTLRSCLREIKSTHNEIGKRERFSALLGALYGDAREVGKYAQGGETSLRIKFPSGEKQGRADTIYGSAVIESLPGQIPRRLRRSLDG